WAGDADAQLELGSVLSHRPEEAEQARKWLLAAAGRHEAVAELLAGLGYDRAQNGFPRDFAQAAHWLQAGLADIARTPEAGAYSEKFSLRLVDALWGDSALEVGLMAYNGVVLPRDMAHAAALFRLAAAHHSAKAAAILGDMYLDGKLGAPDPVQAVPWYRQAAEAGQPNAMNQLGMLYTLGRGVAKNPAKAAYWYRFGAQHGNAASEQQLAALFWFGADGMPLDRARAVKWLRRAAEQGQVWSQSTLAVAYRTGMGVPLDYAQSFAWAQRAAVQGDALSENTVGYALLIGRSVPEDAARACVWLQLAVERSKPGELKDRAKVNLARAREQLTAEQAGSCANQAAEWQARFGREGH
ncbi:MAG TPA: tetratricopeptide repeat protein, partial [Acetobacteraceae bacterium]|nr:tetratricopeptide repeat protein [Acetobacteraceae bacterium]